MRVVRGVALRPISDTAFAVHVALVGAPEFRILPDEVVDIVCVAEGQFVAEVRLVPGLVEHLRGYGVCPVDLQDDGSWAVDNTKLSEWFLEACESGIFQWK